MNNYFFFHTTWHVAATKTRVYEVLSNFEAYSIWWPQVRSVSAIEHGYKTVCKSWLPYELRFDTLQVQMNADEGIIEGRLRGDLEGFARWHIRSLATGSRLDYLQEVDLMDPVLKKFLPIARPAFRWNHFVMMRSGERGLRKYLDTNRSIS